MKKVIFGLIISIIYLSGFTVYGMGKVIPKKTPMQNVGNGAYCWTPDGKIAFYRLIDHWIKMESDPFPGGGGVYDDYEKDDEAFIVVRDPETKGEKVLFKIPYGHSAPHGVRWMDWSGVNDEILMTVFGAAIYAIKSNGEGLRMVAPRDDGLTFGFKQATWTPDGKSIMCIASQQKIIGIYIMDREGKNPRRIVEDADAFSISPDGKQVVYQTIIREVTPEERKTELYRNIFYTSDIYIINTDGTGKRLLVEGGQNPKWSPDGKWIMFGVRGKAYLVSPTEDKKCKVDGYGIWTKDGKSVLTETGYIWQLKVIDEKYGVILRNRKEENGYVWSVQYEGIDKKDSDK